MSWYYISGTKQEGPFEPTECQRLFRQGIITNDTLVWREGMAEWQPWGRVNGTAPAKAISVASGTSCSHCGRVVPATEIIRLSGRAVCANCKPTMLQQLREGVGSNAEEVRRDHIKHEASVRSIGILYFLSAGIIFVMGLVYLASGPASAIAMGVLFCLFGAGQFWIGMGLRRLKSWARVPTVILSGIGLLGIPVGTIINGYILYLVLSAKGRMVFSDHYKAVMAETPDIRYRTSIIVWLFLGLLILLFVIAIAGLLFFRPQV